MAMSHAKVFPPGITSLDLLLHCLLGHPVVAGKAKKNQWLLEDFLERRTFWGRHRSVFPFRVVWKSQLFSGQRREIRAYDGCTRVARTSV